MSRKISLQASEEKKVLKRALVHLINNLAPAVSGNLWSLGGVTPGCGREGGRAGLQSCHFGACCKSQKTCVGFNVQYSYRHVLAGVSSLHAAVIVEKLCQHSLYKPHFYQRFMI